MFRGSIPKNTLKELHNAFLGIRRKSKNIYLEQFFCNKQIINNVKYVLNRYKGESTYGFLRGLIVTIDVGRAKQIIRHRDSTNWRLILFKIQFKH